MFLQFNHLKKQQQKINCGKGWYFVHCQGDNDSDKLLDKLFKSCVPSSILNWARDGGHLQKILLGYNGPAVGFALTVAISYVDPMAGMRCILSVITSGEESFRLSLIYHLDR